MSMFDPPAQDKLSDHFPIGVPFWLLGARYEGIQPTSYGDSPQAVISASPPNQEREAKQFRVWGTLAEQIHAMGEGDLPAEVKVVQSGRKHIWQLIRKLAPGTGLEQTTELANPPASATEDSEPPY